MIFGENDFAPARARAAKFGGESGGGAREVGGFGADGACLLCLCFLG